MVELERATRDTLGPDRRPLIGRGYEVRADGAVADAERLHPAAFADIAVVEVTPTSAEEREMLKTAAFGVGRTVTLRPREGGVAVLDEDGRAVGGWVDSQVAEATQALLEREADLRTWVCWEWLREEGRASVRVALSRPELAPRTFEPLPQQRGVSARAVLAHPRAWVVIAVVVVVVVVAFALRLT